MSIEAIAALASTSASATAAPTAQPGKAVFEGLVERLSGLSERMQVNQASIETIALGGTDNLHQVMMSLERTRLEFDLLLQVRNKTLDAYQELMRMQI